MSFLNLEWWEYFTIIILFFMAFLFINFVLKKYNEARIEDRLSRLLQKASNNQGTQIQELSLEIVTNKLNSAPSDDNLDKCKPQLAGISLVFNREDNINRDINRNNDIIDTNPRANIFDIDKIKKITLTHKERSLPNKLIQNAENTIPIKSIVIKESKDTCTKSVVPTIGRNTQKPEETIYMKIRNTFFKPNKLQPKAVPKITNIGSIFVKDSKIDNHSNKDNVTIKESQHHERSYSLIKFDKSKSKPITQRENNSIIACQNSTERVLQISENSQKVENSPLQATSDSVLKTDILKPIALTMKETNIISILRQEPKADYNTLNKSDLQIPNISQKTKETISLRKSDSILLTNKLKPQTPNAKKTNSDSIIDRDSKIAYYNSNEALLRIPKPIQKSVDSNLVQNSKIKCNNCIDSEFAKPETVQKPNDRLPHEISDTFSKADMVEASTAKELSIGSNLVIDDKKALNDFTESEVPTSKTLQISKDKLSQEINDMFLKTDEVKATAAKETSIGSNLDKGSKIVLNNGIESELLTPDTLQKSKDNPSQERSDGVLKTNKIEPKSSTAKNTDIGNNLVKDFNIAFKTSTESAFVKSETLQSTEQLYFGLDSNITLNTTNLEQNDTQENLASSVNKHYNSKEGSSNSLITIGLVMTEISLKTNKMYVDTDPLETNNFDDHKTYLVNIPVIDTKVSNDTSTYSKYESSDISSIAEEISIQKESDILLQDDKLGVKSIKIKPDDIIKQPMITFSTPTMPKPILPETDKTLSPNFSDTSRNQYNQRMKKFWELFTTKYRS